MRKSGIVRGLLTRNGRNRPPSAGRKRRNRPSGLGGRIEGLESRAMLVGNVTVAFVGGDLIVLGDAADNSIAVEVADDGDVTVRGLNGTTVNGGETFVVDFPPPTAFGLTGRPNDVRIRMGSGNDAVFINGLDVADDLDIDTGSGDDAVVLDSVAVDDDARIATRAGVDRVALHNTDVGDRLIIQTGPGGDVVLVDTTSVGGRTSVSASSGDDRLVLSGANQFADRAALDGGAGSDTAQIDEGSMFASLKERRIESMIEIVSTVRFSAGEGLSVRNLPAGDPPGTGSTEFSLNGANFFGGEVVFAGMSQFYASPPDAYLIGSEGGTITFDEPASVVKFFFVHPAGSEPQTATAYDADGKVLAVATSSEATFLGDPENFVVLAGTARIARIEITGGKIDDVQYV